MKKLVLPLFSLLMALLTSCLNGKYETTPSVIVDPVILVNETDTIGIIFNVQESKYSTDTMFIGDTLLISVAFDAVGNNLTAGQIKYQSEYADLNVLDVDKLGDVFTPTVATDSYSFTIATGYRGVVLQFQYVPKKVGKAQLDFVVQSDSEYSPSSLTLLTPITERPAAPETSEE